MTVQTNSTVKPASLSTVPTPHKPGRRKSTKHAAENLIGVAGVAALAKADLHIVSGTILRELALVLGEPAPPEPEAPAEREGE